jgi:hypothetical protein
MTDRKSEMNLQLAVIVIDCDHADCCQRIDYCPMDYVNIRILYFTPKYFSS